MRPLSFCVKGDKHPMEEIIVIRAADPDGSVFKAVMDALQEKKAEVIDIAAPAPSVLFLGELEIRPAYRQVLLAGKEIRLNHGEYAMLYCMAKTPVWLRHLAASTPENNFMRRPGTRYIPMGQIPWKIPFSGYDRK